MIKNKEAEILLLGLPNSGKSTLINALTKNKTSIIGSKPNTTRDKISKIVSYENDKNILISDLPGFLETPDEFNINYQNNIDKFIKDADKIFFVIDVHTKDFSGLDSIFNIINKKSLSNDVVTVFNKCENFDKNSLDKRLYKYVYNEYFFVSGYHKLGLEQIHSYLSNIALRSQKEDNQTTSLTIIGRPNAGKSTLFNALLNKERSTVSDVPGTTRDKIEENLEANDRKYLITDTAGIPRKKQKDQIDRYSSEISIKSLENTDIALIVVDSLVGLSFEDKRILNSSIENFVTPLLILNKWDLLDTEQKEDINNSIKRDLKQYRWVNVIRVSALSLKNINQIAKNIDLIEEQLNYRISTSELNSYFRELWVKSPPHPFRGKRAKLKFVTQYSTKPPEFGFSLSSRIPKNYSSFIENNIREKFNMSDIAFRIKINA
ncbi:MAG: GTPase Der [Actinomycetota bacterium]|jgi:GTP-binding protein|nr:ribosome biogenesis GTPase Der [bacterium]GIS45179.1 MAG: GTPase Der [Actinomycetota bacterium]|tara:strand:- start:186 stop:1487 length:1302 start_codon:yes stop_codon:yes gene_type:complete